MTFEQVSTQRQLAAQSTWSNKEKEGEGGLIQHLSDVLSFPRSRRTDHEGSVCGSHQIWGIGPLKHKDYGGIPVNLKKGCVLGTI